MIGPELSADVVLNVEVAYALPHRQLVIPLQVPLGTTALETVLLSGIVERFDELDPQQNKMGIFGTVIDPDQPIGDGQRIEIYRPLRVDPKEVRRQLATEGKTIGGGKKSEA